MLITVKTWDGHNINDGSNYRAVLQNQHTMSDAVPVFVDASNADPRDAGVYTVDVQNKTLSIKILNYANRYDLVAQLKTWFKRGTKADLVVTFGDDGVDYQVSARVISLVAENNGNQNWTVVLQTGSSTWRAVTANTYTWDLTGTGGTYALSLAGDDETPLSVSFELSAAPGNGYQYQRLYQLINAPQTVTPLGYGPWCITMDTATPIAAGKMQADCDDLRVYVDGVEVNRWIANPNNASTKIWFNIRINTGYSLTLRSAYDNTSDYDYLEFAVTGDTESAVAGLPTVGILVHGTEWIKYQKSTGRYRVAIVERGVLGTTKQAHSIGDVFKFMEHVITVYYGNSSAVDPSSTDTGYDDTKPLFSLTSSSNASWVYTASDKFYDAGSGVTTTGRSRARTGGFTPGIVQRAGDVTNWYDITGDAASGDPAMGMLIGAFVSAANWVAERAKVCWSLYRGCGIDTTTFTGRKYRTHSSWPDIATGLQKSVDGSRYEVVWAEATPASAASWSALASHSGVSVGSAKWIRVMFNGSIDAIERARAYLEILTATINFVSANLPAATLLSEKVNGHLELDLSNDASGDVISINQSVLVNKILDLDGETKTVLYNNVLAFDAITQDDEGRSDWVRLKPGTNNLTISATDVGTLQAILTWYPRRF